MQYDAKIKARLRKVDGQVNAILRMMEAERDCKDVITQLSAVRSAVDRAIAIIVSENLVDCLSKENLNDTEKNEYVKQAVDLLVKSH